MVLSTATQPALGKSPSVNEGFEEIREIVPSSLNAFSRLRRVVTRWPRTLAPVPFDMLAAEIAREPDVLAIVHRRKDAYELCTLLDAQLGHQETFHLSALMCAEHRSEVIRRIKERKKRGEPVRVVATQLVEAGVHLDFAVVYRALGGMDAMAQAAGRCNREGLLKDRLGELRVFVAPTEPPPGVPRTARDVTLGMLAAQDDLDLYAPDLFKSYFDRLYGTQDLDAKKIQEERQKLNFRTVAELFRLIEDDWSAPLVVPFGDATERVRALEQLGPSRERLRGLQRLTVTVPRRELDRWLATGAVRQVEEVAAVLDGVFACAYDARFGLLMGRVGVADAASLVIDG